MPMMLIPIMIELPVLALLRVHAHIHVPARQGVEGEEQDAHAASLLFRFDIVQ